MSCCRLGAAAAVVAVPVICPLIGTGLTAVNCGGLQGDASIGTDVDACMKTGAAMSVGTAVSGGKDSKPRSDEVVEKADDESESDCPTAAVRLPMLVDWRASGCGGAYARRSPVGRWRAFHSA